MLRNASLCFLIAVGFVAPQAADAQTGPKRKVHIVVAGLTEDGNIGRSVEFNMNETLKLFERGLPDHHRGDIVVIKGSRTNAREILESIDRINPAPNDAIFMYYHGHGAYDAAFAHRDASGGHYLDIPSGDLMRKDLFDRLRSRKAKLTVLVTETCYVSSPANPFHPGKAFTSRDVKGLPVLASLLLNHDGFIDINACAKGEFSWNYAPGRGGSFFSDAFRQAFYEAPFANPSKVTWTEFVSAVSGKASAVYKKIRAEILANADRFDPGLVGMLRGQVDQRLAVIQVGLTHSGGKIGIDDPIKTVGDARDVGTGLMISERLEASDPRDTIRRESHAKAFKVRLEAGNTYVIDLESKDLDPYLRVENDRGEMLMYDDDGGEGLNSMLKFRPATSGVYTLIATTYHPGATGAFTLRVRKEGGGGGDGGGALKVGGGLNVPIRLTDADPKDRVRTSSHFKVVEVYLEAGKSYRIDLDSKTIDPFLRLETAAGTQLAWNDDRRPDDLDSTIEFRPATSGVYRIVCTTYTTDIGEMILRVTEN